MDNLPLNLRFLVESHDAQIIKTNSGWGFLKKNGQGYTLSDDYLRMPRPMQAEMFDHLRKWLEK